MLFFLYSNTTLVKVKYWKVIGRFYRFRHSNTTLVKVKLIVYVVFGNIQIDSNTTLVKVKSKVVYRISIRFQIQIQHLLKLNYGILLTLKANPKFKYNTC